MGNKFCIQFSLPVTNVASAASDPRGRPATEMVTLTATELSEPDRSVLQLIESLRAQARLHRGSAGLTAPANDTLAALLRHVGFADAMSADDQDL